MIAVKPSEAEPNTNFIQYAISSPESRTLDDYYFLNQVIKPHVYTDENNINMDGQTSKQRRIKNIIKCRKEGFVKFDLMKEKSKKGKKLIKLKVCCNSRLCKHCILDYQKKTRVQLREVVKQYGDCRFMTVSFRSLRYLTKSAIAIRNKQFAKFREYLHKERFLVVRKELPKKNSEYYKRMISIKTFLNDNNEFRYQIEILKYPFFNYISIMEIKFNRKGSEIRDRMTNKLLGFHPYDNWNLHYHMIYEGKFIPELFAQNIMKKVTKGDTYHVKINYISKESIRNKMKALNYITKYISKMDFNIDYNDKMIEYHLAIKGVRFVKVYGIKIIRNNETKFIFLVTHLQTLGLDFRQSQKYRDDICILLEKYNLSDYDCNLSLEENIFEYGSNDLILEASGV